MSQKEAEELVIRIEKALVDAKHGQSGNHTVYHGKVDFEDGYPEWLNELTIQFVVEAK